MNHCRAPRRSSTAPIQSDNPMNLPRARRFPVLRNDLPSNHEDLFELVVQTTTSALMQNLWIEELLPILCQSRDRCTRNVCTVLADVTQLLEGDLLALISLSKAITRTPMTPPAAPSAPATSARRRTRQPVVLEDTDNEGSSEPLIPPVLHSFAPAHVLNASTLDTSASTVIGTNVQYITPLVQDTSPDFALFILPKNPQT
ncbi:hypothetical protein BU15DRAFT_83175 [Melanogaster broomeanus]|nr:hypothetical protein BU15DRAFT_83175 [Melanogaster broomeanus]